MFTGEDNKDGLGYIMLTPIAEWEAKERTAKERFRKSLYRRVHSISPLPRSHLADLGATSVLEGAPRGTRESKCRR